MALLPSCRLLFLAATAATAMAAVSENPPLANGPATPADAAGHWAFQAPVRPPLPKPPATSAGTQAIDAFIDAKHWELGLAPTSEADRRTLIRRLSLDLVGLPPSLAEVDAFLGDASPNAYANLVERLLASPHYGERWARHWLDLARWAESDGYEANETRAHAWRYRDYVVKSFNEDKPYDRFLTEQLAGDELEPYSDEHLIATGFLAAGRNNNNEEDKLVQLNEPLVDMANATAAVTLGLTFSCAQCHDHKFEPITACDYYAWHAYFLRGQVNSLLLRDPVLWEQWHRALPPQLQTSRLLLGQLADPVRARLRAAATNPAVAIPDDQVRTALSDDDRRLFDELKKKVRTLEKEAMERQPQTWGFYSPATSPHVVSNLPPRGMYPFPYTPAKLKATTPRVLQRGDVRRPGDTVVPDVPAVLAARHRAHRAPATRLELARWLTSEANPLTARVWVNYVWQQHFGRGLVETPGDFGVKGAKPVSPELLDWLACELRENGWSTKHLHRLVVNSAAYRRASKPGPSAGTDPGDQFLWRWIPRRLEGEGLRDSMLSAAGVLDRTMGGPSVPRDRASHRRSLYQLQARHRLPQSQALFDAPSAHESCPRRHVSTMPLQPLYLLNHEFNVQLAGRLAGRVQTSAGADRTRQVETAFLFVLSRPPDATEIVAAETFFAQHAAGEKTDHAFTDFCQALMNLNEFVYIP